MRGAGFVLLPSTPIKECRWGYLGYLCAPEASRALRFLSTRRELGPALSFEGIGLPSLVGRYAAESKVLTPEADALIKSSFAILPLRSFAKLKSDKLKSTGILGVFRRYAKRVSSLPCRCSGYKSQTHQILCQSGGLGYVR